MIGRAVIERLQGNPKYDLKAQVRDPLDARAKIGDRVDLTKIQLREADFTRIGDREIRHLTKGCDIIIHAAGLVHRPGAPYQEYEVVNVRATQALAESAASNNARTFIFLSSSAVYGQGPFNDAPESAPLQAKTPYAVSKVTSERFLQSFTAIPKIVILRPSLVFGEGDRGNLLSLIREIKNQRFVQIGAGTTAKSIVYARDVAYGVELSLALPDGIHTFNIANPDPVTMKELTDAIAEALNLQKKISSMPEPLLRFGAKAAQLLMAGKAPVTEEQINKLTTTTTCSTTSFVAATGFKPQTSLIDALKAEIAWATQASLI